MYYHTIKSRDWSILFWDLWYDKLIFIYFDWFSLFTKIRPCSSRKSWFLLHKIRFCKPCQENWSLIVFPSNLNIEDIIWRLQSINIIKSAATEILKSLKKSTFNLKNKLYDAEELKNSSSNTQTDLCHQSSF